MLDYAEKRDFPRMTVDCAARFRVLETDTLSHAIVKDLSGGGMLIWTDDAVEAGSRLRISVEPVNTITPPLYAEMEVVRCAPQGLDADKAYSIACTIVEVFKEDEVGESFLSPDIS